MHTESTTLPGRHDHPPQTVAAQPTRPVRRVGLLDRAALHVGVALIKWGRRPVRVDDRESAMRAREVYQAREKYERVRAQYEAMHLPRIF